MRNKSDIDLILGALSFLAFVLAIVAHGTGHHGDALFIMIGAVYLLEASK